MGSGASSASALRAGIAATSEEDLKSAFNALSPDELARLNNLVQEVEETPKLPTFEKPPMEVPGISKEEALPKRAVAAIEPPAGRPRSAEMKKKQTPAAGNSSEKEQVTKPEVPMADSEIKIMPNQDGKTDLDKVGREAAATKIQAVHRGKASRRQAEAGPIVTKDEPMAEKPKADADAQQEDKVGQEAAATKIQAVHRGKAARRQASQTGEDKQADGQNIIASKLEKQQIEEPLIAEHTEAMAEK